VRNHLTFTSTVRDAAYDKEGEIREPAGKVHADLLRSRLAPPIVPLGEPWNEENYAWDFLTELDGTRVSVLVGRDPDHKDRWLAIAIPVAFLAFLRRKKLHAAADTVADAVEAILKSDPRFTDIRRYTEAEYNAIGAAAG
jgi:hypothetical protein